MTKFYTYPEPTPAGAALVQRLAPLPAGKQYHLAVGADGRAALYAVPAGSDATAKTGDRSPPTPATINAANRNAWGDQGVWLKS